MATVVLLGTLDTKGREYAFLRERLLAAGVDVVLVDTGVYEPVGAEPDIARDEVAAAAGEDVAALAEGGGRGEAIAAMSRGAGVTVQRLYDQGRLDGVLAAGGSGGTSLASHAMRTLPIGVPKLLVSTVGSGDTRPYVGATDIAMLYSVVDIAGVNRVSARILANAAAAMAGMARVVDADLAEDRPLIGATMFGVTTPCVTAAREALEGEGYEVLVFHATGTGGRSLEALVRDGFLTGVLDITTTELADELVGGVFSAGPDRLQIAGELAVPQVVSLGALDMVNFGAMGTVPERFGGRNLYVHNPTVTLMRTTPEECRELGATLARKLNAATGLTALYIPLRGVSAISTEGGPFYDPEADDALFSALREGLSTRVELVEMDTDINDPAFALAMVHTLEAMIDSEAVGH